MVPFNTIQFRTDGDDISAITGPGQRKTRKLTPKKKTAVRKKSAVKRKRTEISEKEFKRREKELMAIRREPWFKKSLNKLDEARENSEAKCSKCQSCERAMMKYLEAREEHTDKISRVYDRLYPMG